MDVQEVTENGLYGRRARPPQRKREIMTKLDDAISELIGDIANLAVANGGTKITLKELAIILTILDIESDLCDHYKSRKYSLISKAYNYFSNKGDTQTADDIKKTCVKSGIVQVIP
jgi:hypothetical protein